MFLKLSIMPILSAVFLLTPTLVAFSSQPADELQRTIDILEKVNPEIAEQIAQWDHDVEAFVEATGFDEVECEVVYEICRNALVEILSESARIKDAVQTYKDGLVKLGEDPYVSLAIEARPFSRVSYPKLDGVTIIGNERGSRIVEIIEVCLRANLRYSERILEFPDEEDFDSMSAADFLIVEELKDMIPEGLKRKIDMGRMVNL